jgi:hypothetical protein
VNKEKHSFCAASASHLAVSTERGAFVVPRF